MDISIKNLSVKVEENLILNNLSVNFKKGETIAISGKNGSGKSSLFQTIMGNPKYKIVEGVINLDNTNSSELSVDERARMGIFLAFQYPVEIPGLNMSEFLRLAYNTKFSENKLSVFHFRKLAKEIMAKLKIDEKFLDRNLNEGFSGGEKKRAEILQLFLLKPNVILLDEVDSGLDIDGFKSIFENLKIYKKENPTTTLVIISHYEKVYEILPPDFVVLMDAGKIKETGGIEIIKKIQSEGYEI